MTSLVTGDGVVHEVDLRNAGTLAASPTTTWWRFPRESSTGGSSRSRRTRSRRSCSAWLSTSPRTNGSPRRPLSTGDMAIARKALLAHPLIGQHPLNEELVESLLAAEAERLPRFGSEALA